MKMDRTCQVISISYVCLIVFILIELSEAKYSNQLNRQRRYLSFGNISRFFVSMNKLETTLK